MKAGALRGHGAMLCANMMWGLMSPVAKFVMVGGALTPLVVTDLRVIGAMVLFWIVSFFQKQEYVPPKDLMKLFAASLLAIVFNQGCFVFGVGLSSPVDASIITTSMPLIAMVLAAVYLKEPITGRKIMGIAAGAAGALLLILSGNGRGGGIPGENRILGDMLVLLAQCSYALYIVLFKNFVGKYSPVTIMKWMFTYSFICLLPFSYTGLMATDWVSFNAETICGISFIVVGGTFLSYIFELYTGHCRSKDIVAHSCRYVQLCPAGSCRGSCCILGLGFFQLGKNVVCRADFCRCLSRHHK